MQLHRMGLKPIFAFALSLMQCQGLTLTQRQMLTVHKATSFASKLDTCLNNNTMANIANGLSLSQRRVSTKFNSDINT